MLKKPTAVPLIKCVLNVSEGRNISVLDEMAAAVAATPDCHLLHRDLGYGAHRTVFTFAGTPMSVFTAAYTLFRLADRYIDLGHHRGEHPRMGAADVCPFVPIRGIDYEELVKLTDDFARRVSADFELPIYLYERSARSTERRSLAAIRRQAESWPPDYGPARPHPRLGATVMGVRPFLIAWNINLAPEVGLREARNLAARLRGSGRAGRPGLFPGLRAIGWHIPEYGRCQVSCNVVEPDTTPLAKVYLTALGLTAHTHPFVTGSELIGLVPARHLRAAAQNFAARGSDDEAMFDMAADVLGLHDLSPFDWRERVLEARLPTEF